MSKSLFIAEKPSVAREFASAIREPMSSKDGYMESEHAVVTWCVGHLVTMSYPDKYDEKYKRWSFETLPFIPKDFLYEVIPGVKKQFGIVKGLLNRQDVETIYVCTDSGREGEYIYRLVAQMAGVSGKNQKRVWIDSQTEEEIRRGIREAKDLTEYDHLADSAYLRAKEDYLMGINFSRALSIRYAGEINRYIGGKYQAVSVGRVMTCVLGMVVRREMEIRNFVKTPFYRVMASHRLEHGAFDGEWRAVTGSHYENSPKLYKENGFRRREDAEELIKALSQKQPVNALVKQVERKTEKKNPPLLYNLAELQNECSRHLKISPDQTLAVVQELYERKLVTYPRTDARVLSTAVAKEISKNISGLRQYGPLSAFAVEVLENGSYKGIGKSRYTNDSKITDHYAIIPTGQGLAGLDRMSDLQRQVYDKIARRFLSIFFPPAEYQKLKVTTEIERESFFAGFRMLKEEGYLRVAGRKEASSGRKTKEKAGDGSEEENEIDADAALLTELSRLRKGSNLPVNGFEIKEGETSPPKRYTSGSMILAMENAGQLIEDEDLRAQIKGSGIGTSATRAEILKKLCNIRYLALNKKTQIITPTQLGEIVYDVVDNSIRPLLNPDLTASWEKGLTYVAEGNITPEEYMEKLSAFVVRNTMRVQGQSSAGIQQRFRETEKYYGRPGEKKVPRRRAASKK